MRSCFLCTILAKKKNKRDWKQVLGGFEDERKPLKKVIFLINLTRHIFCEIKAMKNDVQKVCQNTLKSRFFVTSLSCTAPLSKEEKMRNISFSTYSLTNSGHSIRFFSQQFHFLSFLRCDSQFWKCDSQLLNCDSQLLKCDSHFLR